MGGGTVLTIGFCHILVMKGEYYWGIRWWPALLFGGSFLILVSLLIDDTFLCGGFGILGFSLLWSIYELFKQKERVKKGWFPKNPKRKEDNLLQLRPQHQ
jgi:hypothetical protein